jgi:hypothetical protein
VAAEDQDLRQRLGSVLDGISDEFLQDVAGGIFTLDKLTKADCPHCHQSANVRVPDYRGITTALATLADQGKGKAATAIPAPPKEASKEELLEVIREEMAALGVGDLARLSR